MKFGMFVPQGWRLDLVGVAPEDQWRTVLDVARFAEAGPWESVWVYDHFHTVPTPTDEATHEAWTLMAALAAATGRIRLGQTCTCMSYRNPAYLAKVAATVDLVSGGRVEMGIGAGWYEHEWRAYGYGFPTAGERIARLDEGVQIMLQAWTKGRATLAGEHFQVDGAICRPLPLQPGGPPLWIAGGGEKKTLRIAAKYAQYTNFGGSAQADPGTGAAGNRGRAAAAVGGTPTLRAARGPGDEAGRPGRRPAARRCAAGCRHPVRGYPGRGDRQRRRDGRGRAAARRCHPRADPGGPAGPGAPTAPWCRWCSGWS
ncbi:MAG: TIGR03560 family F420-dependent LLM class oxidoreductase [Jiangellaceae bacterium]